MVSDNRLCRAGPGEWRQPVRTAAGSGRIRNPGLLQNAAFEFRRCRAHDGVPKRPAAPFAKRRGPIFGDNFQAVARHCLPCNSGARRLPHNGSPQREGNPPSAITPLPIRAIPVIFPCGGPDFRLAGAHQATYPNAPPKWRRPPSPLTQSSPPTTSSTPLRGRGLRAIVVRPDTQGQRFEADSREADFQVGTPGCDSNPTDRLE